MFATAPYRHLIVNKENPLAACQENVTSQTNQVPKRRALGDVMNTATSNRQIGMTPKSGAKFISNNTPKLVHQCPIEASKLNSSSKKQVNVTDRAELPPVERCWPAPVDTFDDLFEDNLRLTDVFLQASNLKFVGRLPTSKVDTEEKIRFDGFDLESDKEARRQLKRRNKALRKKEQTVTENDFKIFTDVPETLSPVPELQFNDSDFETFD